VESSAILNFSVMLSVCHAVGITRFLFPVRQVHIPPRLARTNCEQLTAFDVVAVTPVATPFDIYPHFGYILCEIISPVKDAAAEASCGGGARGGGAIVSALDRSSLRKAGSDVETDDVARGVEIGDQAFDDLPRLRKPSNFTLPGAASSTRDSAKELDILSLATHFTAV
jgi:hypothetical protein